MGLAEWWYNFRHPEIYCDGRLCRKKEKCNHYVRPRTYYCHVNENACFETIIGVYSPIDPTHTSVASAPQTPGTEDQQ